MTGQSTVVVDDYLEVRQRQELLRIHGARLAWQIFFDLSQQGVLVEFAFEGIMIDFYLGTRLAGVKGVKRSSSDYKFR